MLHVITSNPVAVTSLAKYHDNFIITHLTEKMLAPLANGELGYYFKVYHQDGMDVQEYDEYEDMVGFKYEFIPVNSITQALTMIADDLVDAEDEVDRHAEEEDMTKDEIMVACACGRSWNRLVVKYINTEIAYDAETRVLDLYRHFMLTKEEQLTNIMKTTLQTDFVYPEDPIAYAYALYQVLGGRMI